MDLHLNQWRNQNESEQQQPAKMPKLHQTPHQPQQQPEPTESSALPLFVPESNNRVSTLSAILDSTAAASTGCPRMGSYFSLAQWQELELQALIYRYMLTGIAVPPELLQPIKKSLLHTHSYFLHHPLSYYQPAWYWGRAAMDPEPGRCRRTDGKKWRCSRDVVAGQKYCDRHVHRGRNRSRKPVEIPTHATATTITTSIGIEGSGSGGGGGASGMGGGASSAFNSTTPIVVPTLANGGNFAVSGQSPSIDLLNLNHRSLDSKPENRGILGPQNEVDNRSDGRILRHFFDDLPRSIQEPDSTASPMNSSTCLSISVPGNSLSDVLLKLSTGNEEETGPRDNEREQPQLNWAAGWGANQVASMGGPLAEALRSPASNSSPTSVLHQLPRGSASETYVST